MSAPVVVALQRGYGNRAVSAVLGAGSPRVAVQRWLAVDDGGKMSGEAVQNRSAEGEVGFLREVNVGWILIGTHDTDRPKQVMRSIPPNSNAPGSGRHTEEQLLEWARAQGADLSLAPDDPSNTLRVKALYTERKPCTLTEADPSRQQRPGGCCDALLSQTLHATVPVHYSVDGPGPHEMMRRRERANYVRRTYIRQLRDALQAQTSVHPGQRTLTSIFSATVRDLFLLQLPSSPYQYGTFLAAVIQKTNAGIQALRAWTPPDPETTDTTDPSTGSRRPRDPDDDGGAPDPSGTKRPRLASDQVLT